MYYYFISQGVLIDFTNFTWRIHTSKTNTNGSGIYHNLGNVLLCKELGKTSPPGSAVGKDDAATTKGRLVLVLAPIDCTCNMVGIHEWRDSFRLAAAIRAMIHRASIQADDNRVIFSWARSILAWNSISTTAVGDDGITTFVVLGR